MLIIDRVLRSGSRRVPGSTYVPVFLILASRILTWLAFPQARLAPDSISYSAQGWFNFELVSFDGSAARGWPTTLFFAIFPNDSIRILAQLLLSGAAFGFLIHTLTYVLHGRKARWFFSGSVALIATSPQVLQWDSTILGTSLLISSLVFLASMLIRIVMSTKFDSRFVASAFVVCFLLLFQKFSNIILILPIVVFLIFYKYNSFPKYSKTILILFLLIIAPLTILNTNNQEKYWSGSYSGKTLLWQLGNQSPSASIFKNFLMQDTDAPKCVYENAPFPDLDKGIYSVLNTCEGGEEYVRNHLKADFARFILTHPKSGLRLVAVGAGAAITASSGNYGNAVALLPRSMYGLIWGEVSPDFRLAHNLDQSEIFVNLGTGEPLFLYCPLFLVLGLTVFVASSGRFSKLEKRKTILLVGCLLSAAAQITFSFLMLPSEWLRQSIPYALFGLIMSLFLIAKKALED